MLNFGLKLQFNCVLYLGTLAPFYTSHANIKKYSDYKVQLVLDNANTDKFWNVVIEMIQQVYRLVLIKLYLFKNLNLSNNWHGYRNYNLIK